MTKSRLIRVPSPSSGSGTSLPLLSSHVAPEPGDVGGRAAGRGPRDLRPHIHTAFPTPHQHPPAASPPPRQEPRGFGGAPAGCGREQSGAARGLRSSGGAWARGAALGAHGGACRRPGLCRRRCPAGGGRLPWIRAGVGVPAFPGTSLALLPGLAPPPPGVGLVPATACAHRASARVPPHPARSCQRFPSSSSSSSAHHRHYGRLCLHLLLAPWPPLSALPSGFHQPIAPRSLGCCSRALSLSLTRALSRSPSSFLSPQIRAKGRKHPILLAVSGKVAHVGPSRDPFPFAFASGACLVSPTTLSDAP